MESPILNMRETKWAYGSGLLEHPLVDLQMIHEQREEHRFELGHE